jgi:hypothetical protein
MHGEYSYAMQKKSPCHSCSSQRAVKLCSALCVGLTCATLGLHTHHTIVEKTKADYQKKIDQLTFNYQNPCLEVTGTNPAIPGYTFAINPPLCDTEFDITILEEQIDEEFHEGTRLTARRIPCQTSIIQKEPVKIAGYTCTSNPQKATEITIQELYKRKIVKGD